MSFFTRMMPRRQTLAQKLGWTDYHLIKSPGCGVSKGRVFKDDPAIMDGLGSDRLTAEEKRARAARTDAALRLLV